MKIKSEALICNSCNNRSICKFVEDAKKVKDAYDTFANSVSIPENCIFNLTSVPIICPRRDTIYVTR